MCVCVGKSGYILSILWILAELLCIMLSTKWMSLLWTRCVSDWTVLCVTLCLCISHQIDHLFYIFLSDHWITHTPTHTYTHIHTHTHIQRLWMFINGNFFVFHRLNAMLAKMNHASWYFFVKCSFVLFYSWNVHVITREWRRKKTLLSICSLQNSHIDRSVI